MTTILRAVFFAAILCWKSLSFSQQPPVPSTTPIAGISTTGSDIYKKPLWFDVVNKGVTVTGPFIEYDLAATHGTSLRWGPLVLKEDFFSVNLTSRQKLDATSAKMAYHNQEDMVLFFDWPKEILPYGNLQVTDTQGNKVWEKNIQEADLAQWHEKIIQVKDQLRKQGLSENEIENNPLLKKAYAFFRSKTEPGPDLKINEAYKFCLKNSQETSFVVICTPQYMMKITGTQVEMKIHTTQKVKKSKDLGLAQVKIQNQIQKLADQVPVELDKPVLFRAQLKSGASLEFSSLAPALKIYDMVENVLIAENPRPVFLASKPLSSEDPLDLKNNLWQAEPPVAQKNIFLPGTAGGFFQYNLRVDFLPQEKDRVFADDRILNITYAEKETLKVLVPGKKEPDRWETLNPRKGQWNRSYLLVKDEKREHHAYLDIYRGYSAEASLRLTGLASEGKTAIMAEGHFGYWFNSLFDWDQYHLSRHRWGLNAKYVSILSPIISETQGGGTRETNIQTMIMDLKYRFTPGLWERDESWGALISYENLSYNDHKIPKLGYGFFWARSMPQVFDRLFNIFPFMRFPKWVDLDVVKYSSSMAANYTLGDDYAVNFHGKILWTPRFYGEAGFGVKQYYFRNTETQKGATLNTLYGTLGLGVNF